MTDPLVILAVACCVLSVVPAVLSAWNLLLYRRPPLVASRSIPVAVSVLIPARNEERGIADAVRAALASRDVDLEVVVLDDHSTDRTADIVRSLAHGDPRVQLASAPSLPAGWCGKQHACHVLSTLARRPLVAFIDADVRLAPDGLARAAAFLEHARADLVSGIPRQETGSFLEKLLIPLIHFVLLGFLPMARMRRTRKPAYGAGCGQFFLARREAYERAGGHAAIRASLHDGVTLPRAFRRAGLATDLFDATPAATCRMYRTNRQVWHGLAKNATEGMASSAAIVPWTMILLPGQVLPVLLLPVLLARAQDGSDRAALGAVIACVAAVAASSLVRVALAVRFHHGWTSVLLHPFGIMVLLAIQWYALARRIGRRPAVWRDRAYATDARPSRRPEDNATPATAR